MSPEDSATVRCTNSPAQTSAGFDLRIPPLDRSFRAIYTYVSDTLEEIPETHPIRVLQADGDGENAGKSIPFPKTRATAYEKFPQAAQSNMVIPFPAR
jgi:hypothetical protein